MKLVHKLNSAVLNNRFLQDVEKQMLLAHIATLPPSNQDQLALVLPQKPKLLRVYYNLVSRVKDVGYLSGDQFEKTFDETLGEGEAEKDESLNEGN
ncbi:MAG TPA: hypothetical protein VI981_04860 [Candidatus Paceibacterota bacterium]